MTLVASETTVTTGASVTLTCSAFAQDELSWLGPSRVITNFMNGNGCFRLSETDAPDISHISITCGSGSGALSDWTISILTINNFDPGRDTGYWGCSDFTKSIGDSVYLNTTDAGIKNIKITSSTGFISSTNELTLLSEESDVLTCTAECTGICQYKWMKGTDLVASTSQLSLNNINSTLGGLYTCIATYNGSELKRSLRLYVQDRSSITINPPGDIITVNEGDNITITCSVDSYQCNNINGITCAGNYYLCSNINGITCTNIWDAFYNTGQLNSMVINMANRTMTGRYRCTHFEDDWSSNTHTGIYKSIQLQVQYGPSPVAITPSSDPVTITNGESLSFNCSADCQPDCSYTWKYNNVIVSNISTYIISTIRNSQSGIYTCTATNTLGNMTKSTNVEVNYGPSTVEITPSSDPVTITNGESLSFNCSADCQPDCSYTWKYNNVIVSNISTYIISTIRNSQSGIYTCTATNTIGNMTKSTNVEVNYGPSTVEITPSSDPVTITDGESLSFNCSADCQPDCSYTWKYNNVIVSNIATYIISTIRNSQSGIYTCSATNTLGNMTKSTNVQVNYGPSSVVITPTSDPVTITNGESLNLVCSSDSQPDCNYTWTYNNVIVSTSATYTINSITNSQNGVYTCTASNVIGSAIKSTNVAVNYGPSPVIITPTEDPVIVQYRENVSLVCSSDCKPVCNYRWEYNNVVVSTSATYTTPITQNGTYSCTASNAIGSVTDSSNVVVKSYIKTVVVLSNGTPSTMEPGSSITMTCEADCMPVQSCNYVWKDHQNNILSVGRETTLTNVATSDTGTYTCMASNDMLKSASIEVAIKHAPDVERMVIHRTPNLSSYDKGSSLTLSCSVSCVPDCIVQWSKGMTVFTTSNGVLSLSALEMDDAGTYTCSAGNSMGGPIEKITEFTVKVTISGTGSGSTPVFSWMITVGCLLYALRIY
ncbi:hemicentin-1 [Patella vulgata]|uniref:hemicentin-1 n=1 Tax=Patella vulgata TaxID=6465 RepID=UPI0024A9439B|nr:hemicentin-1 [Patella vulgata]